MPLRGLPYTVLHQDDRYLKPGSTEENRCTDHVLAIWLFYGIVISDPAYCSRAFATEFSWN
jgi:hypothetical protein